ncbi:hypothetical protein GOBAR_AA25688 [Gossypium barbadense]|uniref:Uncharacterized protein n=1 Tax=Gossypium barbadense TaxID=3634 RepID=A0A2P5WV89_GOSBA|nr:hypothetical protein GOBAR_AA25688 [Gossypium barbadense]
MVNQGFIGPPVRDFHSQTLNRYQVSIMTKQAEIQRHRVVEASGCAGGRQLVVAGQGGAAARVLLLSFFGENCLASPQHPMCACAESFFFVGLDGCACNGA